MADRPSFLLSGVCLSAGAISAAKFVMVVKSFRSSFASFIFARDFAASGAVAGDGDRGGGTDPVGERGAVQV